jgi:hypothetical protein
MSDFARSTMQSWFAPRNEKLYTLIGQRFTWDDDSIDPSVIRTVQKLKEGREPGRRTALNDSNRTGIGRCYRSVAVKSAWCRVCYRQWR